MVPQQTVAGAIGYRGETLHSGGRTELRILPAPPGSGLIFRRVDLPGGPDVRASIASVVDTRRCVSIGRDGWRIATIEHLLSAAHGLAVDNLLIEVDGEELPIGDGSASFYADLLLRAGLVRQESPGRIWRTETPLAVSEGDDSYLILLPPNRPGLSISFTFSADRRSIGAQYHRFRLGEDDYLEEIAPARTIAFLEEIDILRRSGLARCDNSDVAVVVGPDGYLNELRFPDEIVRHKILDLLGDLYLVGRVWGKIIAVRSGHRLNHALGRELIGRGTVGADYEVCADDDGHCRDQKPASV